MSVLIFSAETREPISEPRHARQVIASLPVNLYMIFIGVGRFRILGGPRFRILGEGGKV